MLSTCDGGTYTVYAVFSDPAELYGNSQATVSITVTPTCVSNSSCRHSPALHICTVLCHDALNLAIAC